MKTVLFVYSSLVFVVACGAVDVSLDDVAPSKEDVGLLPGVQQAVGTCFHIDEVVPEHFHGAAQEDLGYAIAAWKINTSEPVGSMPCRYSVTIGNVEKGVAEAQRYSNVYDGHRIRLNVARLAHFRSTNEECDPQKQSLLLGVFSEALRVFAEGIQSDETVGIASPACEPMLPSRAEIQNAHW